MSGEPIKPGYKRTEVGVIPNEWIVKKLSELGAFSKGQGIRKNDAASGMLPCIRYGEIYTFHNDIVRSYNSFISASVATSSKKLKSGDILFAGSGETKEDIGKAIAFVGSDEVYAGGDIVILTPKIGRPEFLGYLLNSPVVVQQKSSKGQGDAIVHISASALGMVVIPFPPIPEQRAIATALSDVDALLAKLDQLIAKKRDLKQATMQQLLTGQTRLPGFSGEWEVKRLGDVVELIMGQSPSSKNYNNHGEGLPLIQGNADIKNRRTIKRIFTTEVTKFGRCNDLLLSVRAPVGEVAKATCDVCLGRGVCALRGGSEFLYHYLISIEASWGRLSKGSTFDSINSSELRLLSLKLPPTKEEQTAIAAILSDMDAKIAALESRRDKTRTLKEGMMQELLTGRIRLV